MNDLESFPFALLALPRLHTLALAHNRMHQVRKYSASSSHISGSIGGGAGFSSLTATKSQPLMSLSTLSDPSTRPRSASDGSQPQNGPGRSYSHSISNSDFNATNELEVLVC